MTRFLVQAWDDQVLRAETLCDGYATTRYRADMYLASGVTAVRIMEQGRDYCEVLQPDGSMRAGTFARTTIVREGRTS